MPTILRGTALEPLDQPAAVVLGQTRRSCSVADGEGPLHSLPATMQTDGQRVRLQDSFV